MLNIKSNSEEQVIKAKEWPETMIQKEIDAYINESFEEYKHRMQISDDIQHIESGIDWFAVLIPKKDTVK